MPYYIEACLLRSPYFVTLAALSARTAKSVFARSGRFSQVWSHIIYMRVTFWNSAEAATTIATSVQTFFFV